MKELVEKINAEIEQFQKNADLQVTKGNKAAPKQMNRRTQ